MLREEQREKEIVREGGFSFAGDAVVWQMGQRAHIGQRPEGQDGGLGQRPTAHNSQAP